MSLVTRVQRDVDEYEEKVFFGLTARKLTCLGGGFALCVVEGVVGFGVLEISPDSIPYELLIIATAALGFAFGYYKPMSMPIEQAVPLVLRQRFGTTRIYYRSSVALDREKEIDEGSKDVRKKRQRTEKRYRKIAGYRGERSAEVLFPRYWKSGEAQADQTRAEAEDEGARSS